MRANTLIQINLLYMPPLHPKKIFTQSNRTLILIIKFFMGYPNRTARSCCYTISVYFNSDKKNILLFDIINYKKILAGIFYSAKFLLFTTETRNIIKFCSFSHFKLFQYSLEVKLLFSLQFFLQSQQEHFVADLNVTLRGPSTQLNITFIFSVSIILQHCPTDVTGFNRVFRLLGADGTAYDSQYPRHAFVFIENCTQSGISILRLWPKMGQNYSEEMRQQDANRYFET